MIVNNQTMKRLTTIYLSIFLLASQAQTVTVAKKNSTIKGQAAMGQQLELTGKTEDAKYALSKFLKDYGKTRANADYLALSTPLLGGMTYENKVLYATTLGDENKAQVWMGLDTAEWRGEDIARIQEKINRLLYDFGIKFYRDRIQKEIDESQQAFDATERQRTRLLNQNKDLNSRLVNNEQEKIRLEKAIEANKLEHAVLLQKIDNNKKAQDSVFQAGQIILKVLETQREKQSKVN